MVIGLLEHRYKLIGLVLGYSKMIGILSVLTVIFAAISCDLAADPEVTTQLGKIKGRRRKVTFDAKESTITQYLGIPYAEPPVGDLRFKKPVSLGKFNKTFDASNFGLPCSQFISSDSPLSLMKPINDTSEDCLSLNIFIPPPNGTDRFPVMIFIYGGSFIHGMSSTYDGGILAAYGNVMIVTLNYRLGPFGFLSVGNDDAPGNAGLWDQHLAIKWVKDNIDAFGGDDSRITIFGESAGGSSVSFLTLYPGNKGLFNRAIAESGAASAFWAYLKSPDAFNYAKKYAQKFDCDTKNSMAILKCLRSIKNSTKMAQVAVESMEFQWIPVLDEEFVMTETIESMELVPKTQNIFQDYSMIIGNNGFDGHLFLISLYSLVTSQIKHSPTSMFPSIFRQFLVASMKPFSKNDKSLNAMVDGALFAYTNAANPSDMNYNLQTICDFVTDSLFFIPALRDTVNHAYNNNKSKTYQYEFNHQFPWTPPGNEWLEGATHAGEIPYVFGFPSSIAIITPEIAKAGQPFSKIVIDYWTNFAKTGDPNKPRSVPSQWNEFTNDKREYLYFPRAGSPQSKHHLNPRRADFWTTYLPKLSDLTNSECTSSASIAFSNVFTFCIVLLYMCI